MALQIEALPALYGDSLLLHYEADNKPALIIIDGGPKTVYATSLRKRLQAIKDDRSPNESLPVRMIMVSHIDDDHIRGILDLAAELDQTTGQRLLVAKQLWHNAFTDILGGEDEKFLQNAGAAGAKISSTDSTVPAEIRRNHPSAAMIASVGQGRQLRSLATNKLSWGLNEDRPLIMAGTSDDDVDLGGGVSLTILGPSQARLVALQKEWRKTVKPAAGDAASIVEYLDRAVPNLSSIIALVTDGKKKILLTGDARGDFVLEGLKNANLMKDGKCPVHVLKMPHHGSIRNVDVDFFEGIPAENYLISANGKYNNPDIETLEMLIATRGNETYNVYLTYPVEDFDAAYDRQALQKLIDDSQTKNYKIIPRPKNAKSVVL